MRLLLSSIRGLWKDQRGITGLETSIMLIAFVVVASVFAFAVLRMGVFSSERTRETVMGGLEEITSVLALRGPVIAHREGPLPSGYIKSVSFKVQPPSQSPVELSDNAIVVNFKQGDDDCIQLQFGESGSQPSLSWNVDWANGSGPVLNEVNRPAEITLTLFGLKKKLNRLDGEFFFAIMPRDAQSPVCIPEDSEGDNRSVLLSGEVKLNASDKIKTFFAPMYIDNSQDLTQVPASQRGHYVESLTFLVHNSSPSGTIDLSGDSTVVSYFDPENDPHSDLPFLEDIENTQYGLGWGILGNSGPELGPGERAEVQVNLFGLENLLGPGGDFTVEIRPLVGSALVIKKKLPSELEARTSLE